MKSFLRALRGLPTLLAASVAFVALEEPWRWGLLWAQILFFLTLGVGMIELSLAWNGTRGRRG